MSKRNKYKHNAYDMETVDGKSYLTKIGNVIYRYESTKWDIIRVYHYMHEYNPKCIDLTSGDIIYGPQFHGFKPNLFKFSIPAYDCKFEPVPCNKSNLSKVRNDIKISNFAWFKAPGGDYYFACWNLKKIEKLSLYWTKEGIDALITKRITYEKMLKNPKIYSHTDIHQLCRIPFCKLYFG